MKTLKKRNITQISINTFQKIDLLENHNTKVKEINQKKNINHLNTPKKFINDHRLFFKSILGEPEREYPEKEYMMYKCPFKDHEDKKPSFRVHKNGYYCYGCQKKGNYWQFYKD